MGKTVCDFCGTTYATASNLKRHQARRHAEDYFRCAVCRGKFPSLHDVSRHLRKAHNDKVGRSYTKHMRGGSPMQEGTPDELKDPVQAQKHLQQYPSLEVYTTKENASPPVPPVADEISPGKHSTYPSTKRLPPKHAAANIQLTSASPGPASPQVCIGFDFCIEKTVTVDGQQETRKFYWNQPSAAPGALPWDLL